jgi:hypothetical protein
VRALSIGFGTIWNNQQDKPIMTERSYLAAKVRAKEGATWVLTFRHPLKADPRGRPGRKVRRSSGTADEAKAQALVDQLNELLRNPDWFSAEREAAAAEAFDNVVVRAFYDDLTAPFGRSHDVREARIPLPGRDAGYSRALLVGPTGVGKTSLLRQLIGSHPDRDRFPSTSASRTTISDIEVVTSDEPLYECVGTFFSEWTVQTLIHECVADACAATWEKVTDAKLADRLLQHRDMRFRLSYIIGSWGQTAEELAIEDEDDGFDDHPSSPTEPNEADLPRPDEIQAMQEKLAGFVARIRRISDKAKADLEAELVLMGDDREAAQDRFEEHVQSLEEFDDLVADIMDEVRQRFEQVRDGLSRRPGGWPESWTYANQDREEFIQRVRRLSSNYAPAFGTLLTPLVDGIRIKGPLFPTFGHMAEKLVLLDGEGIGHTKDSAAGVTSHITSRFADVDVILLVDSAKAPMLEAPTSVLRAVAASGHQDKLAIAFTHFDGLKKQANLRTAAAKRAHVMASVHQTLASLREAVGTPVVRSIERNIDERCFMLGFLDRNISDQNPASARELGRLIDFLTTAGREPEEAMEGKPIYEPARLLFSIQGAASEFHNRWNARLGFSGSPAVRRAHWAEIKALNRRVALRIENCEYVTGGLMPAAELVGRLSEWITRYLDTPLRWEGREPSEEEAANAIARVQREVFARLSALATRRLIDNPHQRWVGAFAMRGRGSTFERARAIQTIFVEGTPVPGPVLDLHSTDFLKDMQSLVEEAIREAGGKLVSDVLG